MVPDVKNGILGEQIRKLHSIPLFAPNGFLVNQGVLQVTGIALAEGGDASTVSIVCDPGMVASFEYPLSNPSAADYYWYWPNSGTSSFRLNLDLAATRHASNEYKFQLVFAGRKQDELERIRTTMLIPKYLGDLENYPGGNSLKRVQTFDTLSGVAMKGLTDSWRIVQLARHYGWQGGSVLDWGAGHGRVVRFLRRLGVEQAFGIDIDPDNIGWAKTHLPHVDLSVGPLMPPTPYPDKQFSLIYGISVMTHLTRTVQEAWLEEISRLLQPGGVALLTFAGDASVAFASRFLDKAWLDIYLSTGAGPDLADRSLVGVIETPEYYKNVKQTAAVASATCAKFLDVLAVHECMFGYQDLLVLRKR